MDITLHQYYNRINEIKNNYADGITYIQSDELFSNMQELSIMQSYLEDIVSIIRNLKQDLNIKYNKIKDIVTEKSDFKTYNDLSIDNTILFGNNKTNNIIEVQSISDIPKSPIYWIKPINQYAINLGGLILRGNIGNIYNYNYIKKIGINNFKNLIYCKHENNCPDLLSGKICKYYHDPIYLLSLKDLGILSNQKYNEILKSKNHINTSWIYTEYPEKNSNANMRHFGSYDTLKHFIQLAKIEKTKRIKTYIQNYKDQCIHDILVLIALYNNELI